jgi:hypothetical protein
LFLFGCGRGPRSDRDLPRITGAKRRPQPAECEEFADSRRVCDFLAERTDRETHPPGLTDGCGDPSYELALSVGRISQSVPMCVRTGTGRDLGRVGARERTGWGVHPTGVCEILLKFVRASSWLQVGRCMLPAETIDWFVPFTSHFSLLGPPSMSHLKPPLQRWKHERNVQVVQHAV